jgi:hypothetical protein
VLCEELGEQANLWRQSDRRQRDGADADPALGAVGKDGHQAAPPQFVAEYEVGQARGQSLLVATG